ncbi:methyltransferase family protein [Psychroflexus sp. MBR-150]|jgi:protein-S-isoprenylcysteine O-methyltransferase Ste14
MKPKSLKDIVFVGLQFMLFIAFVIDVDLGVLPINLPSFFDAALLGIGLSIFILSLAKLGRNLSPFPSPKPQSKLVTDGIFKYIRHPIYTAIVVIMLAWSVWQQSLYQVLITFLVLLLFYFKSQYEEQQLMQKFSDYKAYKKSTGRFLPKFRNKI